MLLKTGLCFLSFPCSCLSICLPLVSHLIFQSEYGIPLHACLCCGSVTPSIRLSCCSHDLHLISHGERGRERERGRCTICLPLVLFFALRRIYSPYILAIFSFFFSPLFVIRACVPSFHTVPCHICSSTAISNMYSFASLSLLARNSTVPALLISLVVKESVCVCASARDGHSNSHDNSRVSLPQTNIRSHNCVTT